MKAQNTKSIGEIAEGGNRAKQLDKIAEKMADRNGTGAGYALKKGLAKAAAAAPVNTRKAQKMDKRPAVAKKAAAPDGGVRVARDMTDQLLSKQYENAKGAAAPQRKYPSRG